MLKKLKRLLPFLIGPEGDFTKDEVRAALNSGYTEIELSKQRLRTETAALTGVFYLTGGIAKDLKIMLMSFIN